VQVQGYAQDEEWHEAGNRDWSVVRALAFVFGDPATVNANDEKTLLSKAQLLWKANPPSPYPSKYKFTPFCITSDQSSPPA